MSLMEKLKSLFSKKKPESAVPARPAQSTAAPSNQPQQPAKITKTCKNCGKTFKVDPSWEHIPNFCKECKQKMAREKEERQRAGEPRKIRRKCKNCGNFFSFPSTLPHYPNYCSNCRKQHQAAMKAKYANPGNRKA